MDTVAVVTGGGKGIGAAVARELLAGGARVVAGSRHATADLGPAEGLLAVDVDLATPTGPADLVRAAVESFGGVDVLVNNVGGYGQDNLQLGGFLGTSDEEWQRAVDLNLLSAVRACRAALPVMVDRGGGSVVMLGSAVGHLPSPVALGYGATKAALVHLAKALAIEFGPSNIRVNTVSPGYVLTDLWTSPAGIGGQLTAIMGMADVEQAMLASAQPSGGLPLGRIGTAEEVAKLVAFVAGPAASYLTGAEILLDGGLIKTV